MDIYKTIITLISDEFPDIQISDKEIDDQLKLTELNEQCSFEI